MKISWGKTQQRLVALLIMVAVLVAVFALVVSCREESPAPPAAPPVLATAAATPEPTPEPTLVPVEPTPVPAPPVVTVVGRVMTDDRSRNVGGAEVVVENVPASTDDQGLFEAPEVVQTDVYHVEVNYGSFHEDFDLEPRNTGKTRVDLGEIAVVPAAAMVNPIVTVKSGDTVWDLLTEALGHAPTWEQIQEVVDANGLVDKGVNEDGLWIVLIQIGQVIDLSTGLG